MRGPSLSIGRAPTNDLALPDPDRMISKTHCVIENQNGRIAVVDLSTNGTFLNYGKVPLGKTPTPINDGDVLILGRYELLVSITDDAKASEMDFLDPTPIVQASDPSVKASVPDFPDDDFLDGLLGSDPPKGPSAIKRSDPLDDILPPAPRPTQSDHSPAMSDAFQPPKASGGLIPDDWDDELMGAGPQDPFSEGTVPPPKPEPGPSTRATGIAADDPATRAFFRALGAEHLQIDPADLPAVMERLGTVMRTMIGGIREILMTRTSIKSTFRIDQTMIAAGDNNPLKFSISEDQAVEALVRPGKGYQPAAKATAEAIDDIKAHEVAMVTGMDAAVKSLLRRLDPAMLAQTIEDKGGLAGLLKGRKAQYWEVYERLYAEISDQAESDFHELFSKEFARAYKEQLEKMKR